MACVIRALSAVVVLAGLAGGLSAQDKPTKKEKQEQAALRTVDGTITDAKEVPVPGAIVQLKDMRTLQVRSYLSKEGGKYHFSNLKKDTDYEITATSKGMTSGPRTLSVFDTREAPILNLKMDKKEKP